MLSRFAPQGMRGWRLPLILTAVVTVLSTASAPQSNCSQPCGGQGPYRLFIGPAGTTVPLGSPQYFWSIRRANQDLNGSAFLDLSNRGRWSSSNQVVATIDSTTGLVTTLAQGTTTITFKSGPFQVSTLLTVGPAAVSSIVVTPANPAVSVPGTLPFTAMAIYTDGSSVDVTSSMSTTWTSDDTGVATMAGNVATTVGAGRTYIHATYQTVNGPIDGRTAINAGLTCVVVTPAGPSVAAGNTQPFLATGHFGPGNCADPTTFDVTNYVTWGSSNADIAVINQLGVATALTAGATTISATSTPVTASTNLTVTPPVLNSLAIQPAAAVNIAEGTTQQYTAVGTYSDTSTQDLTGSVNWKSSNIAVATIPSQTINSGLAQASNSMTGSTQITATLAGCGGTCNSNSATLNVTPAVLQSITVTPASPSIAVGNTQQFSAQGNYSNGTTADITGSVTWMSSDTSVATINAAGLAFTTTAGSTTITATSGSVNGAANLTVTPAALASIAVTPATFTIATGQTKQYTAIGTYTDLSTRDITSSVLWQSDNTSLATINAAGLATGVATSNGTAHIRATDPATAINSPQVQLNVNAIVLTSIAVTPGTPNVSLGNTQQFTATGTFSDASTQDITSSVTWTSDNTAVARVCDVSSSCTPKGQAATFAAGTAHVTASKSSTGCGGVCSSPSATLSVTAATLQSVTITPLHSFVVVNQTRQYTATGHYSDGSTRNLTTLVNWSSSNTAIATITSAGLATGRAAGTCTITATINLDGVHSASTDLTVTLF